MYLARFRNGSDVFLQAAFRMASRLADTPDQFEAWRVGYHKVAEQLLALGNIHFAFRIALHDGMLERILICTTIEAHEAQLRQLARAFTTLNSLAADSVQFCADRDSHDAVLNTFPAARAFICNQHYEHQQCFLVPDFRVFPLTGRLLDAAFRHTWPIAIQANVSRYQPDADDLRAARKNLVRVEEASLPAQLVKHQQQLVGRLNSARFLIDEYLGVNAGPAQKHTEKLIGEHFDATLRLAGFASSPLVWDGGGDFEDLLSTGMQTALLDTIEPMAKLGSAVDPGFVRGLLQWRPPRVRPGKEASSGGGETSSRPSGAQPRGRYHVFISYSSKDQAAAERVRAGLEKDGTLRCWIAPRDIDPGVSWAKSIIEGIEQCPVMVLICSGHSNASQQVVREVERAVNKRRILIPFRIDNVALSPEMEYLISAVHWFDASAGALETHLDRLAAAIAKQLPPAR